MEGIVSKWNVSSENEVENEEEPNGEFVLQMSHMCLRNLVLIEGV
jgi:hypothetical protein